MDLIIIALFILVAIIVMSRVKNPCWDNCRLTPRSKIIDRNGIPISRLIAVFLRLYDRE